MPQYLIGLVGEQPDFERLPAQDQRQIMADVDAVVADLQAAGAWLFGGGLGGNDTASVVDARSGSTVVTDGPYVESKEFMGGFSIIEAPDLATAQHWAARFSAACRCAQEVRPIFGPPDEPADPGHEPREHESTHPESIHPDPTNPATGDPVGDA